MSASESSKQCPHCKTFLPAEASVCSACGRQVATPDSAAAPAHASPSEFIPFEEAENEEYWPFEQLPALPPNPQYHSPYPNLPYPQQIGYPPPPPPQASWGTTQPAIYPPQGFGAPAAYPPAPAATPFRRARMLVLIALLVVALGGAAGGIFLALHHASTRATTLDRHGLQNNVPLPDNIAFQYKHTVTQGTLTADEWIWKVSKGEPTNIQQFYREHLPDNGWTHVQTLQGIDTLGVVGCQGSQVLVVGISKHLQDNNGQGTPTTTDAPDGGSALGIALTDNQALKQNFCMAPAPQP